MLENKLNIKNAQELALKEEEISKQKAVELYEKCLLDTLEHGTFKSLAFIHKYLFSPLYDFAGNLRQVNISKGNFRFAPVLYLEEALTKIEAMPQDTFENIVKKYIEMNIAHPFREGNGRSGRIWLDCILKKELQKVVDWSLISKEDYLSAMERSPAKELEIKSLLENALTDKINDREIYLQGIDTSYAYEGYNTFKAKDLL